MRYRQIELLERDVAGIQAFLDQFGPPSNGEDRIAELNATGELIVVTNFPLPDGFDPDYIDLLLMVPDYPARPPVGIYLLERENRVLIAQLRRIFNVMNAPAYSAPTVEGYSWICWHFQGNGWTYNANHLAGGDNCGKFLISFYNRLLMDRGG